ncbi:SEC-C metal-binding domain-containing protein [Brevibacillus laterosporus]|uniref:SEC-C metal-binding domain-containing protein n=1 Tax=Brevibacillus laterosporus TaxID=1465 RepID=UPI0030B9729D
MCSGGIPKHTGCLGFFNTVYLTGVRPKHTGCLGFFNTVYLTGVRPGVLIDVDFSYLTKDDIPDARKEEIEKKSVEYAESRIASFKKQTGANKIGRNDLCPCGSGKKYKRCCSN